MQIKTTVLQSMVEKSIKGAGFNKLIPLTSLIGIDANHGKLNLITTDASNYLYITESISSEDFYTVVDADKFAKLIGKLTSEEVELSITDSYLKIISGNGAYQLETALDENGGVVKYPDPISKLGGLSNSCELALVDVRNILTSIKPSLAVTLENPCYIGYYCGNKVIGTDTYKISALDKQLFDFPLLISPEMMDLLNVVTTDKASIEYNDKVVVISADGVKIYCPVLGGIEDFAIDAINGVIDTALPNKVEVPKNDLLAVLDRLALFVGPYDKNGINIHFLEQSLQITSKALSAVDIIGYLNSERTSAASYMIDINMLLSVVKSLSGDKVVIFYGNDSSIKIVENDITHVIALMEDDSALADY